MALQRVAINASDPSADGTLLAWHEAGAQGMLLNGPNATRVAGSHPAVGGARLAVLRDGVIDVQATSGPAFALTVAAPGADALAVSVNWVAWRVREGAGDALYAAPLGGGPPARVFAAAELGRPALEGNLVAFHVAGRSGGRIVVADLSTGRLQTVRRERRALLLNPSLLGGAVLYVRARYTSQELRLGALTRRGTRRDGQLYSTIPTGRRDAGYEPGIRHHRHGHPHKLWRRPREGVAATLWTTALAADSAYVTRLRQIAGRSLEAEIMRLPR